MKQNKASEIIVSELFSPKSAFNVYDCVDAYLLYNVISGNQTLSAGALVLVMLP